MQQPLIGVTACRWEHNGQYFHVAGDKYLRAVVFGASALPVIVPAFGDLIAPESWFARLDGLLFTGSPSNVNPDLYGHTLHVLNTHSDTARDATTLPLLRAAIEAGVPLLAICRGFQELNVALGGTLHQAVHTAGPWADHREDPNADLAEQYGPAHIIHTEPGGVLEELGLPPKFEVNSLHTQGIETLAPGLRVEARAPDGLIEAVSVESARAFAVGVQFHPEWQVQHNPHYLTLFRAFSKACIARATQRARRDV